MILFYEDWKKYPTAIVHLNTKNESFLRLARLLKYMGIKNHAFMLALHNPLLKNIDPHDPNLTEEQKAMVIEECKVNFWYFIREVVRVPPPAGNKPILFRANRANIAMYWLFFNHITSYLIQPRQTGKSLSLNILHAWLITIGAVNIDDSILTKDDKLRAKTSKAIREIVDYLPPYLKMITKKDIKNSEKITVKALNNMVNLYVGRNDPKAADNVGRGMTTPIVHIDEFAYVPNIQVTLPVLLAATTAAREVAKEQGVPYGTIFTTTAGKLHTKEGKFAYSIYKTAMRWTEKLYDVKNREELEEIISKNSTGIAKVVLLEFNHRQLGYTDEWLKERIATALAEGEDAECDYLNKWISGNESSPLPKNVLDIIKKSEVKQPFVELTDYGYVINWYMNKNMVKQIMKENPLVIGLDTSDAAGRDDIALVIRNPKDGGVIAAGTYNETNLILFSQFLFWLITDLDKSVLIPERRSSAVTIIDYLLLMLFNHGINPFKKIFNWVVDDYENYKNKYPEIFRNKIYDFETINKLKKHFGFATSGSGKTSRNLLYGNVFMASAKYTGDKVRDIKLINQILGLKVKNGRIDHDSDSHDDMVIAWLLGWWFLTHANNKEFYGFEPDRILQDVVNTELLTTGDDEDKRRIKEQEKIREEIKQLFEKLKNEKNEVLAIRYINRIKMLEKKLDKKIIKNFNIDAMLSELKIMKKIKWYMNAA